MRQASPRSDHDEPLVDHPEPSPPSPRSDIAVRRDSRLESEEDEESSEDDETSCSATLSSPDESRSPTPSGPTTRGRSARSAPIPSEVDPAQFVEECEEEVVGDEEENHEGSYFGEDDYSRDGRSFPDPLEPPVFVVRPAEAPPVAIADIPLPQGSLLFLLFPSLCEIGGCPGSPILSVLTSSHRCRSRSLPGSSGVSVGR